MPKLEIKTLASSQGITSRLAAILIEVVKDGGSLGFMHPLDPADAQAFWDESLAAAARGDRVVFGAWLDNELAGTVTLLLKLPPNQPHRAEIAKLLTRPAFRRRGVAAALIRSAEAMAAQRRRTLLVLDTAEEDGAAGFYEKQGYALTGTIPDYALKPHGGLTGTRIYWKRIEPSSDGLEVA